MELVITPPHLVANNSLHFSIGAGKVCGCATGDKLGPIWASSGASLSVLPQKKRLQSFRFLELSSSSSNSTTTFNTVFAKLQLLAAPITSFL